jgi:hypothetical protein
VSHWAKRVYDLPKGAPFIFRDLDVSRKDLAGCMIMAHWFLYISHTDRAMVLINRLRQEKNLPALGLDSCRPENPLALQKHQKLPLRNHVVSSPVTPLGIPPRPNQRKRPRGQQDENVFVQESLDCKKKKTRQGTIHFDTGQSDLLYLKNKRMLLRSCVFPPSFRGEGEVVIRKFPVRWVVSVVSFQLRYRYMNLIYQKVP